eukprot:8664816-Pyramimonas_sp.AAC.1
MPAVKSAPPSCTPVSALVTGAGSQTLKGKRGHLRPVRQVPTVSRKRGSCFLLSPKAKTADSKSFAGHLLAILV